MSELITAVDAPVHPDYHMFGIEDCGSLGDTTPTPGDDWLGTGTTGVLISVGEQLVSPHLRLEVWDGPPPDGPQDHEVQRTVPLFLPTGRLGVNEITGGWTDGLPAVRPGRYRARITGWNRERIRREYARLPGDWDSPEFEAARAALQGLERYLVQLWLETPTAALAESITLRIHAGYPLLALADADSAHTATLPAIGEHRVAAERTAVLMRITEQQDRPTLHVQLWDGPPPVGNTEPHEFVLHLPSAAITIMHLRSATTSRTERAGGAIPLFLNLSAGVYRVRITATRQRYVAQLWPAG